MILGFWFIRHHGGNGQGDHGLRGQIVFYYHSIQDSLPGPNFSIYNGLYVCYKYEDIVLSMYHTSWLLHQLTVDMVQIQRSRLNIPTYSH